MDFLHLFRGRVKLTATDVAVVVVVVVGAINALAAFWEWLSRS